MVRWAWLIVGILSCGCGADLKRVHTPDLLKVSDAEARKWSGAPDAPFPTEPVGVRANWQIHTTLTPWEALIDETEQTSAMAADPVSKDQYILVDLGEVVKIRQVVQVHSTGTHPKRYRIDVAGDHNFPYSLRYVGQGTPGQSIATFKKPVACRFVRITLLELGEGGWGVSDLLIY